MGGKSRTRYSLRNSGIGIVAKSISILGGYFTRILLVRVVSPELVGLNGLFFTILGGLMLSSMGLDTAMAFSLFRPVAQEDTAKQRALLNLYRRIYLCFSAAIGLIGLCVYAFLPTFVHGEIDRGTITLIYFLFLLNTILSYQWASRSMLFFARQKNYVNDLFSSAFWSIQYLTQCLVLVFTKSFVLFLVVELACTALRNISVSLYAGKKYPFLKDSAAEVISKEEKKTIVRNIRAMLLHKSGRVIIDNTDNMLLSAMFGLASVASYSNYALISGSVNQLFTRMINGISASVGNIGATESKEQTASVFDLALFVTCWVFGFGAICLFLLLGPFVHISFGRQYLLPQALTFVLCLNFYLNGVRRASLVFRDSLGLFWKDRYKTIAEGVVNLVFSILLAKKLGITGILLGTTLSYVTVSLWVEPLVLYREYFKSPVMGYFKKLFGYSLAIAAAGAAAWAACRLVPGDTFWSLLGKGVLCAVVPNALLLLVLRNRTEFRALKKILLHR